MDASLLLRILAAAVFGGIIGLERGYRAKEAGFRTHFLVALGSALFMILSAHGFDGVLTTENHRLDVSRIAAQVVSGIGFIGAGTIIFQKQAVHGLTTAAGLWVTAAIGMAAGAGLFLLATVTMVLVLIGLEAFNSLLPHIGHRNLTVTLSASDRSRVRELLNRLKSEGVSIASFSLNTHPREDKINQDAPERVLVKVELKMTRRKYSEQIFHLMTGFDGIEIESVE
jgi:putative Mg2+ transporter-C (MgtC) family protein